MAATLQWFRYGPTFFGQRPRRGRCPMVPPYTGNAPFFLFFLAPPPVDDELYIIIYCNLSPFQFKIHLHPNSVQLTLKSILLSYNFFKNIKVLNYHQLWEFKRILKIMLFDYHLLDSHCTCKWICWRRVWSRWDCWWGRKPGPMEMPPRTASQIRTKTSCQGSVHNGWFEMREKLSWQIQNLDKPVGQWCVLKQNRLVPNFAILMSLQYTRSKIR